MAIYITVDDVKSRWLNQSIQQPNDAVIETYIEDIEDYLLSKCTEVDIQERIDSAQVSLRTIKRILSKSVENAIVHESNRSMNAYTESIGGAYSQTLQYNQGARGETKYLISDEDLIEILGNELVKSKTVLLTLVQGASVPLSTWHSWGYYENTI